MFTLFTTLDIYIFEILQNNKCCTSTYYTLISYFHSFVFLIHVRDVIKKNLAFEYSTLFLE